MAEQTLFGENISAPYDPTTARGNVISGISEFMKPQLQKARGSLARRGFSRYHAPTIEGQVYNPLIQSGAESVRRGLTDLHYKDENLDLAKRAQTLNERKFKAADYGASEARNLGRQKRGQGTVLCTELYRQGLLPFSHIKADLKFLKFHCDAETHENYLRWAAPVVMLMRKSKLVTLLIYPFIRLWSGYMKSIVENKRPPYIGKVIHNMGVTFGQLYKRRLMKLEVV